MYRPSTILSSIPDQIPEHYREEGQDFIEFVKSYYEFLDGSNDRQFAKLRDIDTTLTEFLKYYKGKYLNALPFSDFKTDDIPFLVKNIADLYRSKGTQEALELLFKMFYKTDVETYYPASSILTLSDSKWAFSSYLEFLPVGDTSNFPIQKSDVIQGDTSKATAFVDEVVFYNIDGVQVPVAYISNVYGNFISDDALIVTRNTETINLGKLIYGSISSTTVTNRDASADNVVGGKLKLESERRGVEGEAVISKISDTPTGIVKWELTDGGFGYDAPANPDEHNNAVYVSTQVLIVLGDELDIKPFDVLTTDNQQITSDGDNIGKRLDGVGTVVAYEHPIIYLDSEVERVAAPYNTGAFVVRDVGTGDVLEWPAGTEQYPRPVATVTLDPYDGSANSTITINSMTRYNDTANFELESFSNIETVSFFTDIIDDFKDIPLDAANYGMLGRVQPNDIDTPIQDALSFAQANIGSINTIKVLSSGSNYTNDVRTIIRNEDITDENTGELLHAGLLSYNKGSLGVTFDVNDFIISKGDIMEQLIEVEDLAQNADGSFTNPGGKLNYIARAKFLRRDPVDDVFFFQPLTYFTFQIKPDGFVPETAVANQNHYDITFKGRQLQVATVATIDEDILGANADVEGEASYLTGKIEEIRITNSGFRYETGETVNLVDETKNPSRVGSAVISVGAAGQTEGNWITTTSHLSEDRFIRDNYYYQEYSYDVSSILDPTVYEKTVKDITHVAGTKLFGTPLISTVDNVRPDIDGAVIQTQTISQLLMKEIDVNNVHLFLALVRIAQNNLHTTGQAPLLRDVIEELDEDGLSYGNITGNAENTITMSDADIFNMYANYDPLSVTTLQRERARALVARVLEKAFEVESSFYAINFNTLDDLFIVGNGSGDNDPEAFELEVDSSDPSAYAGLSAAVYSGQFVPNTQYQIISLGVNQFTFDNTNVNPTSDRITLPTGHKLFQGDIVRYDQGTGDSITNLADGSDYFVISSVSDSIQLSDTVDGDPLQVAPNGTGTNYTLTVIDPNDNNPLSIQEVWNDLAGTSGSPITYSQGSVFTANTIGTSITNGAAIPHQFVAFIDAGETIVVDFNS